MNVYQGSITTTHMVVADTLGEAEEKLEKIFSATILDRKIQIVCLGEVKE